MEAVATILGNISVIIAYLHRYWLRLQSKRAPIPAGAFVESKR